LFRRLVPRRVRRVAHPVRTVRRRVTPRPVRRVSYGVVGPPSDPPIRERAGAGVETEAQAAVKASSSEVDVRFRPAPYATAGEKPWRAAVGTALEEAGVTTGPDAWFAGWVDFRIPVPVRAGEAWES
jgi:hypothetical protein